MGCGDCDCLKILNYKDTLYLKVKGKNVFCYLKQAELRSLWNKKRGGNQWGTSKKGATVKTKKKNNKTLVGLALFSLCAISSRPSSPDYHPVMTYCCLCVKRHIVWLGLRQTKQRESTTSQPQVNHKSSNTTAVVLRDARWVWHWMETVTNEVEFHKLPLERKTYWDTYCDMISIV